MEKLYPFADIIQVIQFIRNRNPARYKRVDISETDRGGQDTSGEWLEAASLVYGKLKRIKQLGDLEHKRALVFELYHLAPDRDYWDKDRLAKHFGRSRRQINNWINQVSDDLERLFSALEWIPPLDDARNERGTSSNRRASGDL